MFQSARIKLTAWYLLIIMFVSLFFSVVIYRMVSLEIERFARRQQVRIQGPIFYQDVFTYDLDLIVESKRRFLITLLGINGGILLIAGYLSFFLAGRTLKPIRDMLDDQNRFVSDSSHELRTPLTALKSSLEVSLRDKKLTLRDAKTLIKDSVTEVDKLQTLSDHLLKLTQYQQRPSTQNFESVSLDEIISQSLARVSPLAKNKNIILKYSPSQLDITGNKYALIDLFVILLDNAIKYSPPKKSVKITAAKSHHQLIVSVIDQGVGIDPSDIPHIFNRFYRADTARTKNEINGYGLGLSIAKRIVDNHHGSIKVKSHLSQGSTFSATFKV